MKKTPWYYFNRYYFKLHKNCNSKEFIREWNLTLKCHTLKYEVLNTFSLLKKIIGEFRVTFGLPL